MDSKNILSLSLFSAVIAFCSGLKDATAEPAPSTAPSHKNEMGLIDDNSSYKTRGDLRYDGPLAEKKERSIGSVLEFPKQTQDEKLSNLNNGPGVANRGPTTDGDARAGLRENSRENPAAASSSRGTYSSATGSQDGAR